MRAVLFSAHHGEVRVDEIPAPLPMPGGVLIANAFSLISAGTERSRVQTGQQSLVGKARQRPDQLRQVATTLRQTGPRETYRMVQERLSVPSLMGYSCAGTALEVGAGVDGIEAGSLVAAGGGGYANHAEVVWVPANLCVPVPAGVEARWAAFATVGAIALHGIHQAGVEPGSRVVVIGLGLVGQLTLRLLAAYGYQAAGIDSDPSMVELARAGGSRALERHQDGLEAAVLEPWDGSGADAVIVTAATRSGDPVELAGRLARDRATVVVVGDVAVTPPRPSFYGKELTVRYSRSYGPGRYDPVYEEGGVAYPAGYVPWTERRNMAEVLRLLAVGSLELETLQPVVFPVEDAAEAYARLDEGAERRQVAILLAYPDSQSAAPPAKPVARVRPLARPASPPPRSSTVRIAALGAGSFPARMLFPHVARQPDVVLSWIASASGVSAAHQARRWGFERAVSGLDDGLQRGTTDCVMVLTRHDTHARYAVDVLRRGLALFCEKPLALDEEELEAVAEAWLVRGGPAMVGFNRRFAPATRRVRDAVAGRGPLQISYRIFAGALPSRHWVLDPANGGRILGEVCHFVDTASFLAGTRPLSVMASSPRPSANGSAPQSVTAVVTYADGSTASIVYGGYTPAGAPKELLEVAGNGVAARVDDFRSLQVWSRRPERRVYRKVSKGHREEMQALLALVRGAAVPDADFRLSLWTSLATCRLASAVDTGRAVTVEPSTPSLCQALGVGAEMPIERAVAN
ncbi:MAG TPA: bi-domain-containing oxidoreductase [Acidimicrobiales bacterium]|nr:bi-domain-containing oxidoreductase [Acidimicrobiales bacterium]